MYVKNSGMAWAIMASIAFLAACGPVKFSSSSEAGLDPAAVTPSPTPDDPGATPTPTVTPTATPTPTTYSDKHYHNTVPTPDYKLDIVLVIDDSNSMLSDNQKLATRLSSLITKLENSSSNIDWQMCTTVTRYLNIGGNPNAWGASIYWQPSARDSSQAPDTSIGWILKKGQTNLNSVFTNTINYINAGWANSDDERGIKAAYAHAWNGDPSWSGRNGCYRDNAAVAYIIISDEDERSIGGDASQQVYAGELKALETEDKPQAFVDKFKTIFGQDKRFTVNSIIVKPGDSACKTTQDAQGAKSHYGFKYQELSNLTGGGVGSICATDYSTNMDLFFGKITSSLSSVPLECVPYNNAATVTLTPADSSITWAVQGSSLVFNKGVQSGTTIDIKYKCPDRAPSSIGEVKVLEQPGFFARIVNFFKSLF